MELKSSWLKSTGLKLGVEISGVVMSFNLLGSLYAHSADRDWECYKKLEDDHVDLENNTDIHEIAWQLMNREPGINAKVMMGGGEKTMRMKEESSRFGDDDYSDDYAGYHCNTEDKYEFKSFPKMQTKSLKDFCPTLL